MRPSDRELRLSIERRRLPAHLSRVLFSFADKLRQATPPSKERQIERPKGGRLK